MTVFKHHFTKGPALKVSFILEEEKIQRISLLPSDQFSFEVFSEKEAPVVIQDILSWLSSYANKERTKISLPVNLSKYSSFQRKVYKTLIRSNAGDVFSYKGLAEKIGHPKASRAVGTSCGKNDFLLYIPCHRVIRSDQTLGGFALPLDVKKQLLTFEANS